MDMYMPPAIYDHIPQMAVMEFAMHRRFHSREEISG
jgi:hypothetical protein